MIQLTEIITLIVAGWVAGAESASWACVHPVIKKLPPDYQIIFQQGLLKTFGRIMPAIMTLNFILSIRLWSITDNAETIAYYLRLSAAIALGTMIITTIFFNVPVNIATGAWNPEELPKNWKAKRDRWRFFQGYRSIILVLSFMAMVIAQVYR